MHLFHIPQYTIQNRNGHISVLNGVLWDIEQVHSGIYEIGPFDTSRHITPCDVIWPRIINDIASGGPQRLRHTLKNVHMVRDSLVWLST